MMKGYSTDAAFTYISENIDRKAHKAIGGSIDVYIAQAIDADMSYMHSAGVINENGEGGGSYYDDDDAIEYMLDFIVEKNKLSPETAVLVASLLDDFMDLQYTYMEKNGLVAWE